MHKYALLDTGHPPQGCCELMAIVLMVNDLPASDEAKPRRPIGTMHSIVVFAFSLNDLPLIGFDLGLSVPFWNSIFSKRGRTYFEPHCLNDSYLAREWFFWKREEHVRRALDNSKLIATIGFETLILEIPELFNGVSNSYCLRHDDVFFQPGSCATVRVQSG